MTSMRKTTVWLGRDELNALWKLTHSTGRSRSRLIREGIPLVAHSVPGASASPSTPDLYPDPTEW